MITCAFCRATVPDVESAIDADWIPSYDVGETEMADPVCPACQTAYLHFPDPDGPAVLCEKGKCLETYYPVMEPDPYPWFLGVDVES